MAVLRLFAAAREAAGEARIELEGSTVAAMLDQARNRYGEPFTTVLAHSRVWVNGRPAELEAEVQEHDVVAVLPPVSGGSGPTTTPTVGDLSTPVKEYQPEVPPYEPSIPPYEPSVWPYEPSVSAYEPVPPVPPPAPLDARRRDEPRRDEPGREEPAAALGGGLAYDAPSLSPSPPPYVPDEVLGAVEDLLSPYRPAPELERDEPYGAVPPQEARRDPEDVLDRLAAVPRWPASDPLAGEGSEAEDPDGWDPGTGPTWSIGEEESSWDTRRPDPAPGADEPWGWPVREPDVDASAAGEEGGPGSSAPSAYASPGSDWDRRRDAPTAQPGDARQQSESRPPAPGIRSPALVEPTVRILAPDFSPRAASPPVETDDEPAVRLLTPEAMPSGSVVLAPHVRVPAKPVEDEAEELPAEGPADAREAAPEPTERSPVVPRVPPQDEGDGPSPAVRRAGGDVALAEMTADGSTAVLAEPAPKPKPKPKPPPLAVVAKSNRPHGRLGFVWVVVTVAAIVGGTFTSGLWLAACAGVAGLETARVWRSRNERPILILAGATAAALPLCAISGLRAMNAAVALAVVVGLLSRLFSITKAPARDVGLTLAIGVVIGLAVASVVLLRNVNIHAPLLLLAFAAAYDAGAYLVGTGAASAWEGPAAGVATLIPVTMLSAVILVPPFPEGSPLLLGLLAALLAPCGPLAGSVLLGERDANAPALRRLDSLLVMAPVWAWCAAAFLQ